MIKAVLLVLIIFTDNSSLFSFFFQIDRKKAVAIFLINAGAEVSTQAKNGCTAFDMASLIG